MTTSPESIVQSTYKTVSGNTMTEEAGSCLFVYWGFRGVDYEEVLLYRATIAVSLKPLLDSLLARGSGMFLGPRVT